MNAHIKRLVGVLLLLGFSHLCQGQATDGQDVPLRVLTYNVRYASDQPPNRWTDRRPVAKSMLDQLDVDLIGMQEATYRQVIDFTSDLPEFDWVGAGRDGGNDGEFMAVFYKKARLKAVEHGHYWLSDTPEVIASASWGNECKRMVTWVLFEDLTTRHRFYLVNTHLDHVSQRSRDNSAKLIVERTGRLENGNPVILTGDFNSTDTTSSVYRTFLESGFSDTWNMAEKTGPERNTFHGYRPSPKKGHARIDWILSRGNLRVSRAEIIEFQQNGQFPSDHFPVLAEICFPATKLK